MDTSGAAAGEPASDNFSQTTANHAATAHDTIAHDATAVFSQALEGEFVEASFLIFRLERSWFGVPALMVREIHALPMLSLLQETAPFIVGVLNLRGNFVPVMDLNARFGRAPEPYRLDDSVIVLSWDGADVAILVNEVSVVQRIAATQVEAPPLHSRQRDLPAPFVAGVTQIESGIVMLLHLPHLLNWPASHNTTDATSPTNVATRPFETPMRFDSETRFDAQAWTSAERAILEKRAERLRVETEDNASSKEASAPVALVALGGEEFGVELSAVREFVSVKSVATVPCCPAHILGQINLRGDIVTLVDVRSILGVSSTSHPYFPESAISHQNASLQVLAEGGSQVGVSVVVVQHEDAPIGIVIDGVRDVLYLREDERLALDISLQSSGTKGKFFSGGTLHDGRLLPLLDIARLFAEGHLEVDEIV